jgi:hypothetical protein
MDQRDLEKTFKKYADKISKDFGKKLDVASKRLETKIDAVDAKIDTVQEQVTNRIDTVEERLSVRMDGMEKRLDGKIENILQIVTETNRKADLTFEKVGEIAVDVEIIKETVKDHEVRLQRVETKSH